MATCDKSIKNKSINSQFQDCYISPVKLFDLPKHSDFQSVQQARNETRMKSWRGAQQSQLKAELKAQQDQIKTLEEIMSIKEKNHELDKRKLCEATKLLQGVHDGLNVSEEVEEFLNRQSIKRKVDDFVILDNKKKRENEANEDIILSFDTEQDYSTSVNSVKRKLLSPDGDSHSLLKRPCKLKHENVRFLKSGKSEILEEECDIDQADSPKIEVKTNQYNISDINSNSKILEEELEPVANCKGRISCVFDFEDDPYVLEIQARKKGEAQKLAARTKNKTKGRKRVSMVRMAEYSQSLTGGQSSDEYRQKSSSDQSVAKFKIPKLRNTTKKKGCSPQMKINILLKKDADTSKEKECKELEETCDYTPSIDELLKLPDRPEDGGKTMDEALDELDIQIAERKKKHEEEMAMIDMDIAAENQRQEERKERMKNNAKLRDRLEVEITESVLRKMFKDNLDYLKNIEDGKVESARHQAFHKSSITRHALFYTMITDPFTDNQLEWALEEIGKVWMKTKRQQLENSEYVWKVILAECFIKFYMDHFKLDKKEAECKISESPLRKVVEDGEEVNSSDELL
jgi:hypothetical protein